jgi:hypothetical protein
MEKFLFNLAIRFRKKTKQSLNIKRWYGRRGGSSQRKYICYICDCVIDTESARYALTKHAEHAINKHGDNHIKGSNLRLFL